MTAPLLKAGITTPHRLAAFVGQCAVESGGFRDLNARNLSGAERARVRPQVAMVFQNPYASLNPRKTIGQALEEPLIINTRLGAAQRQQALQAMLARVGLRPEHARRYPHMFSGGQRQRVAIARALMLQPKLVVADEAVSALDVSIQAQVLNLLMDLQQELGIAYLFISHNLQVVRHIADRVMVMYLGRVVEIGPRATLLAHPAHPYTRALLESTPQLEGRASHAQSSGQGQAHYQAQGPGQGQVHYQVQTQEHALERAPGRRTLRGELPSPLNPPSGCAFHQRCDHAIARCAVETPRLEPLQPPQPPQPLQPRRPLPPLDPSSQVQVACLRARELNG